ncbi:MAG: amidohydrolase [Deltaproteobacteria bacterium]|nr:amidohydrolase [Deltaproteobacteria bacterium]MBW1960709.1 amidohydrolase [Deltaproteobacteria bacterium]MBW2151974.1 amidohydrolase [Deltaproteobacteria bacterium]
MTYDLVIHNGTIVTVNSKFEIIQSGFICITAGEIKRIEAEDPSRPLPDAIQTIDATGGIILPGLVNTHSHLPMTLFRGLADDIPLMKWLNEHIFPAERKHVHPGNVKSGAHLGCAEMLLSGTTTCCDGYFYEEKVAEAASEIGIRAVAGQGVIDFPAPGVENPAENVDHALGYIERWLERHPNIMPSVFCHTPYTCSDDTLKKAKEMALSKEVLFQIHVAETRQEIEQMQSERRMTPVKHLEQLGILDDNTLVVHGVWIDEQDIAILADHGTALSHNPSSNAKLAAGIAPVPKLIEAGVTVGIGTDSCASNNTLDLIREMNLCAKLHKATTLDPTVLDAPRVLKMATIEGARAIGLEKRIGSLEVGKAADVIIIDVDKPHLTPLYNPISHLVYAASGSDVRDVIVSGKVVVRNRILQTMCLDDIMYRVNEIAKAIR